MAATKTRKRPVSEAKRKEAAERRQAEASELHRSIANRVKELAEGEAWVDYLRFMQSFHTYSFNNITLMMVQRYALGAPMPTLVAGYEQWRERGYQVRKGEQGMRIFGFAKKVVRDEKGEPVLDENGKPKQRVYFPIVSVFDVTQTDPIAEPFTDKRTGKTYPAAQPLDAHQPQVLTGEDSLGLVDKVAKFVHAWGWTFSLEPVPGEANGYTTLDGSRRVVVDNGNDPAQQAKTALHEAAHMLMHATQDGKPALDGRNRAHQELEAESVAYVLGAMLGLDTEQYSDRYLLHWSSRIAGESTPAEAIKRTAERVQKAVRTLYDALSEEDE